MRKRQVTGLLLPIWLKLKGKVTAKTRVCILSCRVRLRTRTLMHKCTLHKTAILSLAEGLVLREILRLWLGLRGHSHRCQKSFNELHIFHLVPKENIVVSALGENFQLLWFPRRGVEHFCMLGID